jgi:predicted P-loop ATPase
MRPPYGKVMEQRKRYASFIATTNNRRPLVDPSGSRRFICVYADVIDNGGRINHNQIYAQLVAELEAGKRYWLTEAENKRLMLANTHYQHVGDYETMLKYSFKSPSETPEDVPFMKVSEIREILAERFPDMTININTSKNIGCALRAMGYAARRQSGGMAYRIQRVVK